MSSNNVEPAGILSRARQRLWRPSITGKLALLYAICTFTLLLIATLVLYWAVRVSIAHDDQRFLSEKVHVLRTMLRQRPNDQALLSEEVDWETSALGHAHYFVQILDRGGSILTQTPGLDDSGIDPNAFPPPIPLPSTSPKMIWVRTPSGRLYLLSAALAALGESHQPRRIVRIALDVSHEDRILHDFGTIAALVLLLGVVLSAALGAGVARRGLRPVGAMIDTVRQTTALRLHQRIDPTAWPQELTGLAEAFNDMLMRLDQAFARLTGYTADLAHELRTPLNNLMGETEVTLANPRSAQEYRQTLESNLEEYQRLARMTDSLLFIARAENPDAHVDRSVFHAGDALREVAKFYSAVAEDAGICLVCEGEARLWADRDLLRRALSNLLSNAIRYTPAGGTIRTRVASHDDDAVTVTVTDTGQGIAPEEQTRVFDRFFRGRGSQDRVGGSGLGLAIVKSIMDLHQGEVHLHSRPRHGTSVSLRFPPPRRTRAAG